MEIVGLVFAAPCSVGVLMTVGGWLFKSLGLFWVGLAIAVISWIRMFILILTDKTYADYETRKKRILEALDYGGVRYPLLSIALAVCAVIAIPVGAFWVIGCAVWKCMSWSRCKRGGAA